MANPRKPARKRRHRPARVQRDARRTGATHLAGHVVAVWATGLMGGSFEGKRMSAIAVAQMTRNNAPCWVAHEFWSSAAKLLEGIRGVASFALHVHDKALRIVADYIEAEWAAGRDWRWDSEATGGLVRLWTSA